MRLEFYMRVTAEERMRIMREAADKDTTVSALLRSKLGLPELPDNSLRAVSKRRRKAIY